MEVTYRNRIGDLFWFSLYQSPRVRSTQIAFGFVLLLFTCMNLDIVRHDEFPSLAIKALAFVLLSIAGVTFLLIMLLIGTTLTILTSRRKSSTIDVKIVATDNWLVVECSEGRSETKWSAIDKVTQTNNFILIYLSDKMAYVIPKRVFSAQEDAQKFFTYISGLWRTAKHKPVETVLMID